MSASSTIECSHPCLKVQLLPQRGPIPSHIDLYNWSSEKDRRLNSAKHPREWEQHGDTPGTATLKPVSPVSQVHRSLSSVLFRLVRQRLLPLRHSDTWPLIRATLGSESPSCGIDAGSYAEDAQGMSTEDWDCDTSSSSTVASSSNCRAVNYEIHIASCLSACYSSEDSI